jgi:hypothetical protein
VLGSRDCRSVLRLSENCACASGIYNLLVQLGLLYLYGTGHFTVRKVSKKLNCKVNSRRPPKASILIYFDALAPECGAQDLLCVSPAVTSKKSKVGVVRILLSANERLFASDFVPGSEPETCR